INCLSKTDKYMTLFWFLGPFIYLIERDPADLWLTIICLFFLIRCIKQKDWQWASQIWFQSALALWLFGLFSAMTSSDPLFTFQQGFVWIRFPLYVAAAQVWLAKDRDIRIVMLLSILIGMLIMCSILITETIVEPKARLIWPYGDKLTGSYIAKVPFALTCVIFAIAASKKGKPRLFATFFGLLSIAVITLSGERTNFLIIACGAIMASLIWKPKLKNFFIIILSALIIFVTIGFYNIELRERFTNKFLSSIPILNTDNQIDHITNPYWGAWRGGIQQGLLKPIKGIGPSGTRKTCAALDTSLPKWLPGKNFCGNHPHNFYVQLFAETGIVGLLIGCIMFVSIILSCYRARKYNFDCPMAATAFVVPLALFFPLQQFGSFYGQWGNLFTWFAIGFAISQYQGWRDTNSDFEK
ncbi:O-antigen ligase family protein, partial [Alphaproteobacteria bacterium]|nr:O-antigen ligase family protein [Alphaproteobacteria bacterium]